MEIKTKFNIGDKVWTIYNDKVQTITINKIKIECSSSQPIITYMQDYVSDYFDEKKLFKTKEELLKSL